MNSTAEELYRYVNSSLLTIISGPNMGLFVLKCRLPISLFLLSHVTRCVSISHSQAVFLCLIAQLFVQIERNISNRPQDVRFTQ